MNFKLTNLSAINQKYGKTMEQLKVLDLGSMRKQLRMLR